MGVGNGRDLGRSASKADDSVGWIRGKVLDEGMPYTARSAYHDVGRHV